MEPDKDYYLDNYGSCSMTPCSCLRLGWLGRGCPNWTPMGLTSYEEHLKWFMSRK